MRIKYFFSLVFLLGLMSSLSFAACGDDGKDGGLSGGGIGGGTGENPNDYKYPKTSTKTIRLLTYNAYYCKSNTGTPAFSSNNTENFAKVIKSLDADVVSIQELDSGAISRNKRFLLEDIKKATGIDYQMVFAHATKYDNGTIGCGILVKKSLPIEKIERITLPGDEPRMLLSITLKDFVFMGTHLDLNDNLRKQSAEIINELSRKYNKPVFLAGDLNDSHKWANGGIAFPTLMQAFQIKSATDGTLPDQPNQTIDYILFNNNEKDIIIFGKTNTVKKLTIDGSVKDLSKISDHYPVYLDIELK